ncbi:MAG: M61 family metallopeptidase [Pirellulales bacterium]|nr:M61 family metallopeptidase [Pirellulales bacterium]
MRVCSVALVVLTLFVGPSALKAHAASADSFIVQADLREAPRGLIRGMLRIPVQPGPLTLVYPKYIPGEHGPTGPITELSGLKFSCGGKRVDWHRDLKDMYAFHLEIPPDATQLEVDVEYLAPTAGDARRNGVSSSQLAVLTWHHLALQPQGKDAAELIVKPALLVPQGWQIGSSLEQLEPASGEKGSEVIRFKPVSLEMLIDQPVLAARYFKKIDLTPGGSPNHVLEIGADSSAALAMSDRRLAAYRRLPAEYAAVFNSRPYERYHFLLALSNRLSQSGLEHHQCSDNRSDEMALVDGDIFKNFAPLLTHEYFHTWNGKHRRPKRMLSPDYQTPMEGDLLWVYEGLTTYYGNLMAVRTGLWTAEDYREDLAATAANLITKRSCAWRPLQDTADAASTLYGSSKHWGMRRRSVDFYEEGELMWLEADTLIRRRTNGKKSLDDFCRIFHGSASEPQLGGMKPSVVPYEVADVYETLNQVVPHNWRAFFESRLHSLDPLPPLSGIVEGGWKLVYTERPNHMLAASDRANEHVDERFSLGVILGGTTSFTVIDVVPNSPADKVGIGPNMKLIAVNGRRVTRDRLRDAIAETPTSKSIELLVENASYFQTYKLEYDGGRRSPHLERDKQSPDRIEDIVAPRARKEKD